MKAAKLCLMLFISIGCLFVFSDTARAGTTVIHVDTEEGGTITDTTGSIVNQNGALFWNGTKWVTNDTAAHMYFTDMRTGERLKNYTTTTIEGSTSGQVVSNEEFIVTATRSLYTYPVACKTGGTFTYEAVQYDIIHADGRHIILRSRGTGHGIDEAYFDIYSEDLTGGAITALRADPVWFNYSGLSMLEALAQTSETDGKNGELLTSDANYFMDISGGSDMGGITFKIHTGTINSAGILTPNLLSSFPVSFSYEGVKSNGDLIELKFLPTLVSENFSNALFISAADSSVTMASGSREISSGDNTWEIELASGTLKGGVGDPISSDDISLSGLPGALTWTAIKNGPNKILITVAGEAQGDINFQKTVSVIVKGSAVSDVGAQDSTAINLYLNPPTYTVIFSNEEGRLLHTLNSGYGNLSWYNFLKGIQTSLSSSDVDKFMAMIEAHPGSQCFTKKISDYSSHYLDLNYAPAISSDGSIQEVPVFDHSTWTVYEYTYPGIGLAQYVHADKLNKVMDSWAVNGTNYLLVLDAWLPATVNADLIDLTISEGTLVPDFLPEQTQYTDSVANSVTSVTVTPTVSFPHAAITVQGQAAASGSPSQAINLAVGENTIQVVVSTSEEGSGSSGTVAQTYTIIVTRAAAPDSGGGGGGSGLTLPIVVTSAASTLSDSSAVLNGEITARGGATITAYGFSYKPEGGDWTRVQVGGDLLGSFSYSLSGLTANTEYIFKAYAVNSQGTAYGQEKSFLLVKEKEVYLPSNKLVMRFYIDKYQYYVNDQEKTMDTVPIIYEDRTLLPIGYVAQYLGATVNWDSNESKVTIVLNGQTIELWIGQGYAKVNGLSTPIDPGNPAVVPIIQAPGRSMLPLSFISEALGCTVDWNPDIQEIKVTYPK
ncbi:MAG: stalk domain-containing protein [Syntrophomonas sp.]